LNLFALAPLTLLSLVPGCAATAPHAETTTTEAASSQPSPATAPTRIDSFSGTYRFLSNFWPAEVEFEDLRYPTAEHAYQAAKTTDVELRLRIAGTPTPAEAKRVGNGLPRRQDWEQVKLRVMEECVRDKFTRHPDLGRHLLATGDAELVEGNTWGDRFWGVCDGEGQNHLGRILMKIRAELRAATDHQQP